jgi:hypothetical protein
MTARAAVQDETQIEEGQASLDAFLRVPHEETPEEIVIDAGKGGIRLLSALIRELQQGKTPTCTIQEIGQALVGRPAPQPNWYEKVTLAKRQDKLLRNTMRSITLAIDHLDNDLYATRVKNAREYLEDAYNELKDDYGYESTL